MAKLRDDMIKRYLYNEAAKPNDGYTENMYFSNFLGYLSNQMGILNHYKVKIIDGRFDFDAQGKVELITFGPSAYVEVNDKGEAYFTSASNHDRTYLNAERLESAKANLKRVENYRTFFAAAGKGLPKDSHSWAQDYQGGKYGSLRHFGVGAEGAFYVK